MELDRRRLEQERQEREALELARREEEAAAEKEAALLEDKAIRYSLLPEEPSVGTAGGVCTVAVRLFDGSRRVRRFGLERDSCKDVHDWVDSMEVSVIPMAIL